MSDVLAKQLLGLLAFCGFLGIILIPSHLKEIDTLKKEKERMWLLLFKLRLYLDWHNAKQHPKESSFDYSKIKNITSHFDLVELCLHYFIFSLFEEFNLKKITPYMQETLEIIDKEYGEEHSLPDILKNDILLRIKHAQEREEIEKIKNNK